MTPPAGAERIAEAPGPLEPEPGSFRDRDGQVHYRDGRVLRSLSPRARENWLRLRETDFFRRRVAAGDLVATDDLGPLPDGGGLVEHERIPFVSWPYEWPFGMLKDAALLHLGLMRDALAEGFVLRDATPYNVQWRGARPVFIDIPSLAPLPPGAPWAGYRQFCELMLYPLMLQAYRGVDFRPLLRGRIDGIPAGEMRRLLSARDRLRRGVALHVVAQAMLQGRYAGSGRDMRGALAQAGFDKALIERNVARLETLVAGLRPPDVPTEWGDYEKTHSYDAAEHAAKADFVARVAGRRRWRLVWDIGCNTGAFSRLVEPHADCVVAMDVDWLAVERLYARERADGATRRILPLVVNLADASPSQGWRGAERRDLAGRGKPDLVLCLALIHHAVIGANIPLADFVDWLADLGAAVAIEFVTREDEMVQALLANREDQFDDYRPETFRALMAERFHLRDETPLKGGKRFILLAEPR